jgi:hypothetical protein
LRREEGIRNPDTFEDGAVLQVLRPEDVGARDRSGGHDHGVVDGEPEAFGQMKTPLVCLDRDRNNGDETAQGGEKLIRLIP